MTLQQQYATPDNLSARAVLHTRFGTNKQRWMHWVFDHVLAAVAPRATILELGSGPGGLWNENLDRIPGGWDVLLSDSSPGMVAAAREKLHADRRAHRFLYKRINAQSIPFVDGTFDAVIANFMLYHVPQVDRALAEIRRVLKPGGRFFAATVGARHMRELRDLAYHIDPGIPYAQGLTVPDAFKLENGREKLRQHFEQIDLHIYEDALVVTDVDPVVDYVRSVCPPDALTSAHLTALRDRVMAEMAATGAILVTKAAGMFEARG